jgi:hypothetical protein
MLLPHGFEGQGPEHSSARIERFLTLCAEDNIQVVNATTAAQYFHVLRRQVRREGVLVPLVVFTPKSLLRSPHSVSHVDEFTGGSFGEVLDDPAYLPGGARADRADAVTRVLLCSGKVAYDLMDARDERDVDVVFAGARRPLRGRRRDARLRARGQERGASSGLQRRPLPESVDHSCGGHVRDTRGRRGATASRPSALPIAFPASCDRTSGNTRCRQSTGCPTTFDTAPRLCRAKETGSRGTAVPACTTTRTGPATKAV